MDTCCVTISRVLCLQAEHHAEKLFIMDRNYSVLVGVILTKGWGKRVQQDAALDEVVEQNGALSDAIEFADQHFYEPVWESIAERSQSRLKLVLVNGSRAVGVETTKAILPIRDVSKMSHLFIIVLQSWNNPTYFHRAPKSWKLTVPVFCLSNIPIIKRTVSLLNGVHVPLLNAACSSSDEIYPDRSRSTLKCRKKILIDCDTYNGCCSMYVLLHRLSVINVLLKITFYQCFVWMEFFRNFLLTLLILHIKRSDIYHRSLVCSRDKSIQTLWISKTLLLSIRNKTIYDTFC